MSITQQQLDRLEDECEVTSGDSGLGDSSKCSPPAAKKARVDVELKGEMEVAVGDMVVVPEAVQEVEVD